MKQLALPALLSCLYRCMFPSIPKSTQNPWYTLWDIVLGSPLVVKMLEIIGEVCWAAMISIAVSRANDEIKTVSGGGQR